MISNIARGFLIVFLVIWSTASTAASPVSKFMANGAFAYANLSLQDGTSVQVYVSKNDTQTNMYYTGYDCVINAVDSSYTCTYKFGTGMIPNNAYTVTGDGRFATLNFDTSSSGFYNLSFQYTCNANFYCTYSNFTPITTLINIKWMKSVAFSSESTGQTTENFGSLSIISNGSSSAQGADVAAGSFWGEDVVSSAGSMGINRNITITINQNSP